MTRDKLIGELDAATDAWGREYLDAADYQSHQHAHHRVRSEVGVKLFGHDLTALEERARVVAEVLRRIPGAADVYPEQVTGRRIWISASIARPRRAMASRSAPSRTSLKWPWARQSGADD